MNSFIHLFSFQLIISSNKKVKKGNAVVSTLWDFDVTIETNF